MNRRTSIEARAAATPRAQIRGGNLYWEPSKTLRALGFATQALGPLSPAALNRADELNAAADAELDRRRKGRERASPPAGLTMGAIFDAFENSKRFASKAPTTRRHYAAHLKALRQHFGPELAAVVGPKAIEAWYETLADRTPRQAHNIYRTLRLALSWAVRQELLAVNAARAIGATQPRPRQRIATREELAALVAAADRLGRRSIGDFAIIAVTTMQRVSDVLTLTTANRRDGLLTFRQGKTGRTLAFEPHPAMLERLGDIWGGPRPLVMNETNGRPYAHRTFNDWWTACCAEAAKDCPSITGADPRVWEATRTKALEAEDLRRTGMVWAAEGGADETWIVSISGHDIRSGMKILDTYIPRERQLAARAMARLSIDVAPATERRA